MPSLLKMVWKTLLDTPLVKMSASCFLIFTNGIQIMSSSSSSLIKCLSISMCILSMEYRIVNNINSCLVVTIQSHRFSCVKPLLFQHHFHLKNTMNNCMEFCLCTGHGYNGHLFLTSPGDQISTDKGAIPWVGSPISNWTYPVSICIGLYW